MQVVKPSAEILAMTSGKGLPFRYADSNKLIELAGRTCYKSEHKITEESADGFVEMLKKRGHFAMLEHSWSVISTPAHCCYSPFLYNMGVHHYKTGWFNVVAGNKRAFLDSEFFDGVKNFVCLTDSQILEYGNPNLMAMTVKFICDRGVSHELVRHRIASFAQESTRYCNYGGKGISIIHPPNLTEDQIRRRERHFWEVQKLYDTEILEGVKPEIARGVLPTALKTEIVVTASFAEWQHIFNLRLYGTTGKPHPQMDEVMQILKEQTDRQHFKF